MNGSKINQYVAKWRRQGYPLDIPDSAPDALTADCLAPSYRAICLAILSNDHALQSLGFAQKRSVFYDKLKSAEVLARGKEVKHHDQDQSQACGDRGDD